MSYTNGLDNPELYFQTKLWTGDNSGEASITLDGSENMQPDWSWIKSRGDTNGHALFDSVRGATKQLTSNSTAPEATDAQSLKSNDSDGFTIGTASSVNANGHGIVGWNWKASGSTASNTDGSITSTVSANTTAGFSIVSFTASSGGTVDTIGHGLGVAPSMIICKSTTNTDNWFVYHNSLGATKRTMLNLTNATDTNTIWGDTNPSSTVFSLNVVNNFGQGRGGIAYVFAEKQGYSKFGSYTGNGNADVAFVYTGFKPAWVMIKQSSAAGEGWHIFDNKREGYNVDNDPLVANTSNAEGTSDMVDITSNGFKCRTDSEAVNQSGATYIYMAFAESPLVNSNGVPNNAR